VTKAEQVEKGAGLTPTPPPAAMSELASNTELLRSLGRLVRGLSALFWGLPASLLVCFHAARSSAPKSLWWLPPVLCTGWLVYGLWQLGDFQKQERVWRNSLDRAQVISFINFGLSPFLFWWSRMPLNVFFTVTVIIFAFSALLFLASLNVVLRRLGAMLPDEALRHEARQFTALNLNLISIAFVLALLEVLLHYLNARGLPWWLFQSRLVLDGVSLWLLVPLVLLPLAMTMALLWKTKEVILDSVFSGKA
jgi:hypothetical protein